MSGFSGLINSSTFTLCGLSKNSYKTSFGKKTYSEKFIWLCIVSYTAEKESLIPGSFMQSLLFKDFKTGHISSLVWVLA